MQGMGNILKKYFSMILKKFKNCKKKVARMEIYFITFFSILLIF